MDVLSEYEKGDLEAIKNASTKNLSKSNGNDTSSNDFGSDNISDQKDREKNKIDTDSRSIESTAKVIAAGGSAMKGNPKRFSDYIEHIRYEIPNFEELVKKNPRLIRTIKNMDRDVANKILNNID